MTNLIVKSVTNKINSTIIRELYSLNVETDAAIFAERLAQVEQAMDICFSLDDAWEMAVSCANLWMPTPQSKALIYNSVAYNTVKVFCLCVKKAYRGY